MNYNIKKLNIAENYLNSNDKKNAILAIEDIFKVIDIIKKTYPESFDFVKISNNKQQIFLFIEEISVNGIDSKIIEKFRIQFSILDNILNVNNSLFEETYEQFFNSKLKVFNNISSRKNSKIKNSKNSKNNTKNMIANLRNAEKFIENYGNSILGDDISEVSGYLDSIKKYYDSLEDKSDFIDEINKIEALKNKIKNKVINNDDIVNEFCDIFMVIAEVIKATNTIGGIALLREKALKNGSAAKDMLNYAEELMKYNKVDDFGLKEALENFKAQAEQNKNVAKFRLRQFLKKNEDKLKNMES